MREPRRERTKRPVLYLDIDGVLHPGIPAPESTKGGHAEPPKGLREFMTFATTHFEVRWLSEWSRSGALTPHARRHLEAVGVDRKLLEDIEVAGPWRDRKTDGILWESHLDDNRPFLWLDDDVDPEEVRVLEEKGFSGALLHVDVNEDPKALTQLPERLRKEMARRGLLLVRRAPTGAIRQ